VSTSNRGILREENIALGQTLGYSLESVKSSPYVLPNISGTPIRTSSLSPSTSTKVEATTSQTLAKASTSASQYSIRVVLYKTLLICVLATQSPPTNSPTLPPPSAPTQPKTSFSANRHSCKASAFYLLEFLRSPNIATTYWLPTEQEKTTSSLMRSIQILSAGQATSSTRSKSLNSPFSSSIAMAWRSC
jgi:hypothetical protein